MRTVTCRACGASSADPDTEFTVTITYTTDASALLDHVRYDGAIVLDWIDRGSLGARHQHPVIHCGCGHSWTTRRPWATSPMSTSDTP